MVSNQKLFSVGYFDFRLQHLLVIGILSLSFSISILARSGPALYGFELFEFDPFFNFRATEYIIQNGPDAYFEWLDTKTWHPFGRDVSSTSQVTLHILTASLYPIFGFGSSLYHFTILLPLVFGSLTAIVIFAFVRVLGGTTAGLFAALIFSISVPIFSRGLIGWFKSEPLGLFLAFLALYLFVSGIKFNKGKVSIVKLIAAGLFLSLALSSWGGTLFFVLAISAYYFVLPFVKHEKSFLLFAAPTFSFSLVLFSLLFERTSSFVIGYAGFAILFPTAFVICCEFIKKISNESQHFRNLSIFLTAIVLSGIGIVYSGFVALPSFRYLNAVNPFLTSQDALTDSVAEHMTTELTLSYTLLSVFIIFALIGSWLIFSKKSFEIKNDMRVFALIISFLAIYVSSAFVRLELFASIGALILGSIGITILLRLVLKQEKNNFSKLIFTSILVILFIIPVTLPENNSWLDWSDFPPSILSGGSNFPQFASNDWLHAMQWLKTNTPEGAVVAAWWDYGYWITTLSERTTLADNATLIDWQIKKLAYSLISSPDNSWHILNSHYTTDVSEHLGDENIMLWGGELESDFNKKYKKENNGNDCKIVLPSESKQLGIPTEFCHPVTKGMDADYLIIYLAGERFYIQTSDTPLYTLEGGGDESKKAWFVKISNHQVSKYIESDNISPTPYFLENSTLGTLIPFDILRYVQSNTGKTYTEYSPGLIPVYVKNFHYTDPENDPYILVYASPSFHDVQPGIMSAVLIYKINPDYTS